MTYNQFIEIVEQIKKTKPILFELEKDKVVSEMDIFRFENDNSIVLPDEYKKFVIAFGGGYFGYSNIYSLDKDSSLFILENQHSVPGGYLAIADNECGDYYVLKIENDIVLRKVLFYGHEEQRIVETKYEDVFEFLVGEGLKYQDNQ